MNYPDFIAKAEKFFGFAEKKLETLPDGPSAQAEFEKLRAENAQNVSDLAAARDSNKALQAEVATLQEANKTLSDANTKLSADLKASEESVQKRAAVIANEIAAKMGVPPIREETPKAEGNQTDKPGKATAYDTWQKQFPRK